MLRIEEDGRQLRVIVPGAARVYERQLWNAAGVWLGVLGAMALASVWAEIISLPTGLAWGVPLLLAAAWVFRKAARLPDIVWVLDHDKRTLEHAGRVVAHFDELSSVRCRVSRSPSGLPRCELVVVLRRNRSIREVRLADTSQAFGSAPPSYRAVFEQAAARIAAVTGARLEVARRASST